MNRENEMGDVLRKKETNARSRISFLLSSPDFHWASHARYKKKRCYSLFSSMKISCKLYIVNKIQSNLPYVSGRENLAKNYRIFLSRSVLPGPIASTQCRYRKTTGNQTQMDSQLGHTIRRNFTMPLACPRRQRELSSTGFGHESALRWKHRARYRSKIPPCRSERVSQFSRSNKVFSLLALKKFAAINW